MQIIDSEGRLFGYVNVIDVLVVLLALAVGVAGVALVAGSGTPSSSSSLSAEYATLTVGPISSDASVALASADNLTVTAGDATLEVVDAVRTPHPSKNAVVTLLRVRIPDEGSSLSVDRPFEVRNGRFTYNASLSGLSNATTIARDRQSVVVRTTVSEGVAGAIGQGDAYRIGNQSVASVTGIRRLSGEGGTRRLLLRLQLRTIRTDDLSQFAGRPLRLGTTIPFRTAAYTLTGEIVSRNGTVSASRTRTVQLETTVPLTVATAVDAGDQYTVGTRSVAEIESVSTYPVSQTKRRLAMTVTLQTTSINGQSRYLGQPVRLGASIPFATPDYRFEGTVVGLDDQRAGTPVEATLRVEWSNVRPALADAVRVGMTEKHRGATATITSVVREPATVVLRTKDGHIYAREHPVNEDVTLTLDVQVRRQDGTLYFHDRPVQSGDEVVLDLGSVTVRGTVLTLETGA